MDATKRRRFGVVVAVFASLLFTAGVSVHPGGGDRWTAFNDFGQLLAAFAAAAACLVTARRSSARERVGWWMIGAGAAAWGLGQILWTVSEVWFGRQPTSPSPCDAGFLLAPLLIVGGLLVFVDTPAGRLSRIRGAFEGSLVAMGMFVPVWAILLAPVAAGSADPLKKQVVTLAYPVLDAVAIASVLFVVTRRRTHEFGNLSLLAAGIVLLAVADSSFWYLTTVKDYQTVNASDAGWFVGFLLVAFGAVAVRRRAAARTSGGDVDRSPALREGTGRLFHDNRVVVAVPGLIALAGLITTVGSRLIVGRGAFDLPVMWMVVALVVLALSHGLSVVVENHTLTNHLEDRVARRTEELAGRERHFAALVERSSDIVAVIRPDLTVSTLSHGVLDVYGWASDTFVGRRLDEFGDRFSALVDALINMATTSDAIQQVAWELVDHSGRQRFADSRITNMVDDPDVGGYVVNTHDVTDQTVLERELRHQAFHDRLSGLPNRALFNDRVEHALARAERTDGQIAVMVIDLDGFKDVNDSLGHHAGDALLSSVARELDAAARVGDTVARLGGDEFVVLLEDLDNATDAVEIGERFRAAVCDATLIGTVDFHVTASIGVALSERATSVGDLLRDADIAMYIAKKNGKNALRLFEPWMRERARERFQVQSELAGALDRGEFALFYQPSYVLATGRLEGFEALLRWNHPTMGLVSPDQFIPLAEETSLIVPLGRWVLQEATRQLAAWSRRLHDGGTLTMAINVSVRQMRDEHLVDDVRHAITAAGIAPQRVVLEVTESLLVQDPQAAADVLRALKAEGVRIAIDDFGTGYSSLSNLQDLPADILKIDKVFVSPTGEGDAEGHKLLGAILNLAHTLGLTTIAEGVEQSGQVTTLIERGCDIGQGFLWSRPLPADEAWDLLTANIREQVEPPRRVVGLGSRTT